MNIVLRAARPRALDQAQERHVETGLRTEELLQITSGVEPHERVIVSAIQRLRPGLKVEVLEEPPR